MSVTQTALGVTDSSTRGEATRSGLGFGSISRDKRNIHSRPAFPGVSASSPGGKGTEGADGHCVLGALPAHVLEGVWQGAVLVQAEVGHHEREGGRHPKVGDEADEKGRDDAHGDGLLGVLDLLPCREQGVSGGLGTTPWHAALWGPGPSPAPQTTTPTSPGTVFWAFTLMVGKEGSPPLAENTREAREPGLFSHQDDRVFSGPMSPGGCTGLQPAAANAILPARRGPVVSFRVPLPVRPATRGVMKRKISRKVRTHTVLRRERAATGTHAPGKGSSDLARWARVGRGWRAYLWWRCSRSPRTRRSRWLPPTGHRRTRRA